MQIVKIKRKKEILFFPLTYINEIKGQYFVYFMDGEGYKKTKVFEVLKEEIPDRWSEPSWLEIMYIHEKYGIYCASAYVNSDIKEIRVRYLIFQKAKHLLSIDTDVEFFELIRLDYFLVSLGIPSVDILKMDEEFGKRDSEYNPDLALYRGKPCSVEEYVKQKFGERYAQIMRAVMKK